MKLIRFGNPGEEKPGLQLEDGRRIDASAFGSDYDEKFFGGDGRARERQRHPHEALPGRQAQRHAGCLARFESLVGIDPVQRKEGPAQGIVGLGQQRGHAGHVRRRHARAAERRSRGRRVDRKSVV